jgi:hypothetical protein
VLLHFDRVAFRDGRARRAIASPRGQTGIVRS